MPQAYANLQGLVRLSRNEGIDIRPSLLRVLTDLYVQEPVHSPDEEQQYLELALRLLPAVDVPTRVAVATKLSTYGNIPAALQAELLRIIPGPTTQAHGQRQAADLVTPNARDGAPLHPVARPGPGTETEAPAPAHSSKAPSVGEVFLRAAPEEREALLVHVQNQAAQAPETFAAAEGRAGCVDRLEAAARQRNQREFARELQLSLGLSSRVAWQIVLDDFGEPLLIAARALAMPSEVLLRILLFLKPSIGESVERVFALIRLYDRIDLQAGMPILASWRAAPGPASQAKFQPLLAPDAAPSVGNARENARTSAQAFGRRLPSQPATGRERKTS
jgi:hypothetical protein